MAEDEEDMVEYQRLVEGVLHDEARGMQCAWRRPTMGAAANDANASASALVKFSDAATSSTYNEEVIYIPSRDEEK